MKLSTLLRAGLVGIALAVPASQPASAQNVLNVMRGAASNSISVAVNRAVGEEPFDLFGYRWIIRRQSRSNRNR